MPPRNFDGALKAWKAAKAARDKGDAPEQEEVADPQQQQQPPAEVASFIRYLGGLPPDTSRRYLSMVTDSLRVASFLHRFPPLVPIPASVIGELGSVLSHDEIVNGSTSVTRPVVTNFVAHYFLEQMDRRMWCYAVEPDSNRAISEATPENDRVHISSSFFCSTAQGVSVRTDAQTVARSAGPSGSRPRAALDALMELQRRFVARELQLPEGAATSKNNLKRSLETTKQKSDDKRICHVHSGESMTYCCLILPPPAGSPHFLAHADCFIDAKVDNGAPHEFIYIGKANRDSDRWDRSGGHMADVRDYIAAELWKSARGVYRSPDELARLISWTVPEHVFLFVLGNADAEGELEAGILQAINGKMSVKNCCYDTEAPLKDTPWGINRKSGNKSK